MSIILFFVVLFVLILVHEWGHFIVAKKTGMRVDEFGIGFPPRLFGKMWRGTFYTFNALPIGGFVRIYGENAADASVDKEEGSDVSGSFTSKSKWAQAAVLIAGVTMNILFAWLLFVIAFMVGVPTAVDEETASENARLSIQAVLPDSPAALAGIPAGAQITSVANNEQSISSPTPTEFRAITTESADTISITYTLGDEEKSVTVTPTANLTTEIEQRAIGVSLAYVETVKTSFFGSIKKASVQTVTLLGAITYGIYDLIVGSIAGTADFSAVAGPVGIVGMVGDAAAFGVVALLTFTAIISLNLAVINMLPFPALDGGRLLFVAIEAVIRRPINPVWVARLNGLGFLLLIGLMVAVTYSDITKLL